MTLTAQPTEEIIRVLFIEDDPAVSEMYKLKLELDGYQVAVVANDDQVLAAAARTKPDMIFIDLRVGDDKRFATLQRLRATAGNRNLPVLIMSYQGVVETTGGCFKVNMLDYIVRADPAPSNPLWHMESCSR